MTVLMPSLIIQTMHGCAGMMTPTAGNEAAVALYRALLLTMPASAHAWFQHDLRDRSLAQAIKAYTVATWSGFLLHQELDMVEASHNHLDRSTVK